MRLLLTTIAALAVTASASALFIPDTEGTLAVQSRTATTVTLSFTQTVGAPTTVTVDSFCYAGSVYAGSEVKTTFGTGTVTFNVGPRRVKKDTLTPTDCHSMASVKLGSNAWKYLAEVVTLP